MKPMVYILYFPKSNKYYVGSTDNLARRLKQHANGHTLSTKRLGSEFSLAFSEELDSLQLARKVEYRIKSWKRRDYVERIIQDRHIAFLKDMHL